MMEIYALMLCQTLWGGNNMPQPDNPLCHVQARMVSPEQCEIYKGNLNARLANAGGDAIQRSLYYTCMHKTVPVWVTE